jgi:hypothetical protein
MRAGLTHSSIELSRLRLRVVGAQVKQEVRRLQRAGRRPETADDDTFDHVAPLTEPLVTLGTSADRETKHPHPMSGIAFQSRLPGSGSSSL